MTRRVQNTTTRENLAKRRRVQNGNQVGDTFIGHQGIRHKKQIKKEKEPLRPLKKESFSNVPQHVYNNPEDVEYKFPDMRLYQIENNNDNYNIRSDNVPSDHEEDELETSESDDGDDHENAMETEQAQFSISGHLGLGRKQETSSDLLTLAIASGNALRIGKVLRHGFAENSLSDIQIEELIKSLPRPNISLYQHYLDYEDATESDRAAISMGQLLLTKIAMMESKSIQKIKASVNSLASSFVNQTKVSLLTKRSLTRRHLILETGDFPNINLADLYDKHNLVGDCAYAQMTFFLTRVFKTVLQPKFAIWNYTFRPRCVRPKDKHFTFFPDPIAEALIGFAYDVIGIFLPDDLLHGPIPIHHEFFNELGGSSDEKRKEIERRRSEREMVSQTMQSSIGQMLNYLRDYHYDVTTMELESCKRRKMCRNHLTWKDLKQYRHDRRANGEDPEQIDAIELIGYSSKHHGEPSSSQ